VISIWGNGGGDAEVIPKDTGSIILDERGGCCARRLMGKLNSSLTTTQEILWDLRPIKGTLGKDAGQ
jgi:hypothetical protein